MEHSPRCEVYHMLSLGFKKKSSEKHTQIYSCIHTESLSKETKETGLSVAFGVEPPGEVQVGVGCMCVSHWMLSGPGTQEVLTNIFWMNKRKTKVSLLDPFCKRLSVGISVMGKCASVRKWLCPDDTLRASRVFTFLAYLMIRIANDKGSNRIVWQAVHHYPPRFSPEKHESSSPKDNRSPENCSSQHWLFKIKQGRLQ